MADLVQAQNLVLNGSFEKYYKCPNNFSEKQVEKFLPNWSMPTKGTPDYFNKCSKDMVGVPQNFIGNIHAFEGVAYVGLVLMDTPKGVKKEINYREYLQTRFSVSLQRDQLYVVKFYYSLAAYSTYGINRLGVYFSQKKISQPKGVFNFKPQLFIDTSAIYCTPGEWIQFCDTFRAYGGENFLTIGNFYKDSKTKYIPNDISMYQQVLQDKIKTNQVAYYYIDNVSVEKIDKKDYKSDFDFIQKFRPLSHYEIVDLLKPAGEEILYILDEVYFDLSSSESSPVSFYQLNNLYEILNNNPCIGIKIIGLLNSNENNDNAAKLRIDALLKVLSEQGIGSDRLTVKTESVKIFPKQLKIYIHGKQTDLFTNLIAVKFIMN